MAQVTFEQLVDQAIEKLTPLRQRLIRIRICNNESYRENLYLALADKCCTEMPELEPIISSQGFGDIFSLDLDKIDQLLALIVKYLPSILELILKFV